jgi:hypothetical protein
MIAVFLICILLIMSRINSLVRGAFNAVFISGRVHRLGTDIKYTRHLLTSSDC